MVDLYNSIQFFFLIIIINTNILDVLHHVRRRTMMTYLWCIISDRAVGVVGSILRGGLDVRSVLSDVGSPTATSLENENERERGR